MAIDPQVLPLFAGSALILTLIPGVNVFMVLRSTINSGIRSGLTVVAGSLTASALQTGLVVSGVGTLLVRHPNMLTALRWVGACYLVYLAGSLLRQLWHARRDRGADSQAPPEPVAETGSYVRGLAGNLTNPKRWLFCLTVLPQFLGQATAPVSQLAMLGATFLVVTSAWECTLAVASSRIAPQLRRPGARQLLDAVSATVFLGLSAGLVAT